MKNKILILLLSIVTLSASAQVTGDSVLRSKKGIPILPQKGDWAIGADALPYLQYLGNMFNNNSYNSLNLGSQTLYGRYFIADNAAIRFLIGIDKGSDRTNYYVRDDAGYLADPLSRAQTTDYRVYKHTEINLDLGYQKFRGYGRLRGFYGAHLGLSISREGYTYNYGNPMSLANSAPTTVYNWTYGYTDNVDDRTLESDNGINYGLGLGLIAGVEYYFLPKICIGGEITLSAYHSWKTQGNSKYEHLNGSVVEEYEIADSPKGRTSTEVYTSRPANYGGSLYLMFHF
jgi:hypothetical protein